MNYYEQEVQPEQPYDYNMVDPMMAQQMLPQRDGHLFSQGNDLKVIQEYNQEENLPEDIKKNFWSLISKSIKLGFWQPDDYQTVFLHKNIIKVGYIMAKPRNKYTFEDRQQMNQVDMLVYSDFKRGIGMEKYRINERTLQSTMVTQNIQGSSGLRGGKQGGMLAGLKSFFG